MSGLPRLTVTAAIAVLVTALSLQPTLEDGSWMLPTILCVSAVAGVGYLARRSRVPRLLVPVLEVAALCVLLVLRFAQDQAIWGLVPGRDVRLEARALLDEGLNTISSYSAPAPVTPGLVFLLAMSVALVAVIVDTVAVTYRSPALAGLPLLVLYAVPVSVVANGVSWVYFGIASAGWLALLLADGRERLGGWGRRLGTRTYVGDPLAGGAPIIPEPLGAVGRRIGIASVGLAVLLPAIVPGLSEAVFGRGLGNGPGDGTGNTVTTVNPFVSLGAALNRPQDTTVLTYDSTSESPDYLRLVTADTFDGAIWLPASLQTSGRITDGPLPNPVGLSATTATTPVSTRIITDELVQSTWLPAPYPISSITVNGDTADDWVWDTTNRVVWSPEGNEPNLRYSVDSLTVEPTRGQLNTPRPLDLTFVTQYTALPLTIPDLVRDEANRITAGLVSPYLKAVALQNYFQSDLFTYDPTVTPDAEDPLTAFLLGRAGFCQQFAGTYAVMARAVGLPTRVVVGFVPGDRAEDGTWTVSWHDTHAWPEVYFEGAGWVRFEPTKSTNAGVTIPAWTVRESEVPGGERPEVDLGGSVNPSSSPSASGLPAGVPADSRDGDKVALTEEQESFPWVWVFVPLAVVALLLAPSVARVWQRRRRLAAASDPDPRVAAAGAWTELAATCADLNLAWPPSRTPRQVAAELITAQALPEPAGDALRRLALSTERGRYAPAPAPVLGLADDVVTARTGLLEAATRKQRLRAGFAPVSLLSKMAATTADTLDWADSAPRRVRKALSPRRLRDSTERSKSSV